MRFFLLKNINEYATAFKCKKVTFFSGLMPEERLCFIFKLYFFKISNLFRDDDANEMNLTSSD